MLSTTELPFISKILIPKRRDYIVRRDRLLDPVTSRVKKKVQVVYAPAGYGKTALLVEFTSQLDHPSCWYSFSPEDHDPVSFILFCVQSIRAQYDNFGSTILSLLRTGSNVDWRHLLGLLTTSLHIELSGQLVLVFDDVHWTQGKEELRKALSLLIERAPPNVQFLLGSREWPELGCLPRLAAENDLKSVDRDDLRFSTEETAQLLSHLWERPVDLNEGDLVRDRTGGWAAAIMLIAKSRETGGGSNYERTTDDGMLFSYLSEEVFDNLPDPLRSFLLQTSILREFTESLCDSLLGLSSSGELINQVRIKGLFLEERAGQGTAYKQHDLFREFLEHRLKSTQPDEYKRLNLRAGSLYSEIGDDEAAIYHFLQAEAHEKAIAVMKKVASALFDQSHWQKLTSWLARLPKDLLERDPELLLLYGQVLFRLGDPTGSLEQLVKLTAGPDVKDNEIIGRALSAKSTVYRRLGHLDMATEAAEQGLAMLRRVNAPAEYISDALKQRGNVLFLEGESVLAKQYYEEALALISKQHLRLFSVICNDLAGAHFRLGQLDQAATYYEQARSGWLKLQSKGPLAQTMNNISVVYYHKGEFDLAMDEVREAHQVAESAGQPRMLRMLCEVLVHRSAVQRTLGAYAESEASASQALEIARQILDLKLVAESTYALGHSYWKLGETSKAEVLLNQALIEAEDSGQKYIAACYHIALGKVYCQAGSYPSAQQHLTRAEELLTAIDSPRRIAEVKLYQAATYYRTRRLKETLETLTQVADLVSQLGYDGFLLADGDEVVDVLRFGSAKRVGGETFTRLVRRLTNSPESQEELDNIHPGGSRVARFPALRAFSFGHPRVILDTHEVTDAEWRSRKAKELFFFLLCNRQVNSNEKIIESLWPEISADLSDSALKTNIYRLRQVLYFDCILAKESGYCINPDVAVDLDMDIFLSSMKLAADRRQSDEAREGHLREAIELYQGSFLSGFYSEWCQELCANLELKYHTALISLAAFYASRGDFPGAAELLEKVVADDPYHEEAQYQLVSSYLAAKEPFAALEQLRKYTKVCLEELGADLPPRFVDCHRRLLAILPISEELVR